MKTKRYIRPTLIIVRVNTRHIISASPGMNRELQNEEVDAAWARRHNSSGSNSSVWDDEW